MMVLIFIGTALILLGIYFIAFTNIAVTEGTIGIIKISGLISAGIFIVIPPKIYLTLQAMKTNDGKVSAINKHINDKNKDEN